MLPAGSARPLKNSLLREEHQFEMLPTNCICSEPVQDAFLLRTEKHDSFTNTIVAGGHLCKDTQYSHSLLSIFISNTGKHINFQSSSSCPECCCHMYIFLPRTSRMERVLYNDLSFSLKCHLFLHCILSVRSMLSLVQLRSRSYSAQISSNFCTHTKSFFLPFEKSDKWVQTRGAQSQHGCEPGLG